MKVNKKKISKTLAVIGIVSAFSSASFAVTSGAYVGGGVGYSVFSNFTDATVQGNGGVGGKVAAGFNFNQYLGIEAGYAMYPKTSFVINDYKWINDDFNLNLITAQTFI